MATAVSSEHPVSFYFIWISMWWGNYGPHHDVSLAFGRGENYVGLVKKGGRNAAKKALFSRL